MGINFSVNLESIIELNYESKIIEIEKLMKIWSIRKLTILGRITVLKGLVIPKLTHLFIALPNPSQTLLKYLNTVFFKFIWHCGTEKLARSLITQNYKDGGVKMINVNNYITALKNAWIRRMFTNNPKWTNLFKSITGISTMDLIIHGDYFIISKLERIVNKFWRDTLYSWAQIQQKQHPQNVDDILGVNIWYNSKICIDRKPFLYKKYLKIGIIFIGDLLNEQGDFHNYEEFIAKYHISTNFLQYASLINATKSFIHNLNNLTDEIFTSLKNPIFPFKLGIFFKDQSGCKRMYELLNTQTITPKAQLKYANEGFLYDTREWEMFYTIPFHSVKDASLVWFQYRILHRILATNKFLHMIHYIDSDICSFCNTYPETLQHLFFKCDNVYNLWKEVKSWILSKTGIQINFSKDIVMFGMANNKNSTFINWLTINIKYYIYNMKIQKKMLNINSVKNMLKNKFYIEKYILFKNCSYEIFNNQWTPWLDLFI